MSSHLQILQFCGINTFQFVNVVPKDVPTLTNMELNHFLNIYLVQLQHDFRCILSTSHEGQQGGKIHQIPRIYGNVNTKEQVNTWLVSPYSAGIFNIVDHQAQGGNVKDSRAWVSQKFSYEHAEYRSPSLSSSIQKVPDRFAKCLVETLNVVGSLAEPLIEAEFQQLILTKLSRDHRLHSF